MIHDLTDKPFIGAQSDAEQALEAANKARTLEHLADYAKARQIGAEAFLDLIGMTGLGDVLNAVRPGSYIAPPTMTESQRIQHLRKLSSEQQQQDQEQ